jgi:transmembrane sensor
MSHREFLLQRYYDKTATTEELVELARIMAEEGYQHEDELFNQLMKNLQQQEDISDEDKNHVATNLYFKRADMETVREEKSREVPIERSRRYTWWSAAAIVVAIGLAWYNNGFKQITTTGDFATAEIPPDTVITISSGNSTKFVVLPDKSTVLLNENSSITYTKRYGFDTREITLTGEGFFDVAHNPLTPFRVKTGRLVTNVLGTAFNIKVIKDPSGENKFTVTVSRGKVAVNDDRLSYGTLTPNEQINVNTDNHHGVRTKVNATLATSWTSQFIIINDQPFENAVQMIEAKFNVKIAMTNEALKQCRITSAFLEKPKFETVIKVICAAVNASYTIDKNGGVTISGGECNDN